MFHFCHNYDDYDNASGHYADVFFRHYAEALGTTITPAGRLVFPEQYATGFIQMLSLSNGLMATLSDYKLNQDFFLERKPASQEFYALRVHETTLARNLPLDITTGTDDEQSQLLAAAWLSSSLFEASYIAPAGTGICGLDIVFTREWMATYLGIGDTDDVLQRYVSLKSNSINFEPMDAEYRELLHAIIEDEQSNLPLKKAAIENRVMEVVERFFTRLFHRMQQHTKDTLLKPDEIRRIMEAEAYLVKDFAQPAPTIPMLSRFAAMSDTKFKTLFKRIYGCGPYEYFQKNRMLRAKYLLVVKKTSVKEAGIQLGYTNLSNFTIAYKKAFNTLPSGSRDC